MTANDKKSWLFLAFLIWIFVSAFYYTSNLIEGHLLAARSENVLHKAFKYAAAIFFSISFYMSHKSQRYILQSIGLSVLLLIMSILLLNDYNTGRLEKPRHLCDW